MCSLDDCAQNRMEIRALSVAGQTRDLSLTLPAARAGSLRAALLLAAICSLPILLYIPFLLEPFMRDEGFYATVAQILLDGGVPYRDAFDNKPPLIFGWFSLSFLMFGETVWAPRLLAAICLSATTALVYAQGRLVYSHAGGLIAALAFALSIGIADYQTNANTEYFLVLPMVAALVTFTMGRRTGAWYWFAASGMLSGLAIMTKQVAGFNFLALLAVPAIEAVVSGGWRSLASRAVARQVAPMLAGCTAALVAVVAPFVAAGALWDFVEAVFVYAVNYSSGSTMEQKLNALLFAPIYVMLTAGPWVLLAGLGVAYMRQRGRSADQRVLVLWLAACVLGVGATGRFYDHYFVQALPAMALLAPAGVFLLKDHWHRGAARVAAMWLLPVSAALPLLLAISVYTQPTPEARHEQKYGYGLGALENSSQELAEYVASITAEDDLVYNLGFQSELYFYADRAAPTRYLFDDPFGVDRKHEEAALADLRRTPPRIVIDSAAHERQSRRASNYYPVLIKGFIDENYDYLGRFYYADLYRLKDQE